MGRHLSTITVPTRSRAGDEGQHSSLIHDDEIRDKSREITLDLKELVMTLGINEGFGCRVATLQSSSLGVKNKTSEIDSEHKSLTLLADVWAKRGTLFKGSILTEIWARMGGIPQSHCGRTPI